MGAQPQIEKKLLIWGWTSQKKTGRQDDMISPLFVLQGVTEIVRSHPFNWTPHFWLVEANMRDVPITNLWQLSRVKLSFYILNPNFWWVNPYVDAWDCCKFGSPASEKKLRQASLTSWRWCRLERCRRFRSHWWVWYNQPINQPTNVSLSLSLALSLSLSLSRLSIYIYTRAHACISYIYMIIYAYIQYIYIYIMHTRMLFLINYLYSQPPWGGAMVREIVKHQQTTKHGERPSKRNEFVSWCVCKKGFDPGTRNNGELTRINHQPWHICRKEP